MAWTRIGKNACNKPSWQHSSGWTVHHCGHQTAIWPYFLLPPNGWRTVLSFNGMGFKSAEIGKRIVEMILAGIVHVTTKDCVPGGSRTENATALGELICCESVEENQDRIRGNVREHCTFHGEQKMF